ncbi:F-box/kelch-repeat protein At3g23880-like [Vicia villosa]|uniref:F-box/kelch-repeat protein At3g23880-like n=1 Tax=Vicia villosa TaxID=3911 RepID=UPI00273CE1DB|nr:F-box/kelch-repeat protein At3g23880-like [Vicia villosa]
MLSSLKSPYQSGISANVAYGFGYDTIIEKYKVVVIFIKASGNKAKIKVHDLGTNSWRMVQDDVLVHGTLTFVKDTLHWFEDIDYNIVFFNFVNDSYQKFTHPNYGLEIEASVNLSVLRDFLCILARRHDFCDVWQMKHYGNEESWSKLCRVHFPSLVSLTKAIWISTDDQVMLVYVALLRMNVAIFRYQ